MADNDPIGPCPIDKRHALGGGPPANTSHAVSTIKAPNRSSLTSTE